ncbi:zinc-dependent alcohol dehydrogenase family protein [Pseudoalteromonas sp. SR41-4]|uniref:zinc-dependent alcohol dehydrogenase family protein n=1 Tax=Pseudoalteromonas sp. SR41-4 TaxID=2760950 RepID=UPI0016034253|nr:zinc-dependent alcohol dehydrogenase family protein [Pseudoalteromonas sp. SR41-4]MBB1294389.1 zinc-dependent alcohol dehydrogenase family protein [Pseudoalteromonas sp. SR41-4]
MKAMIINEIGTTEVFQLVEKAKPVAKKGHIVVEVKATSVNPIDTMLRSVELPWSANLPEVLHGDVAGIVSEVGEGVTGFIIGDEVYGMAGGVNGVDGALAEFMLVDARLMAKKPKTLTMKQAAALPLVSITSYEALVHKMNVKAGDNVLIHGATGGVGHIAVQLAKVLGANVTSTYSPANEALAKTVGADNLVDYTTEKVANYVAKYTDGVGFDKIFDTVSGKNIQKSFEAAKFNGHVSTILPIEDPLQIALKSLSFHSVLMLIPLVHGINHESHGQILTEIAELVDAGKITPIIDESDYSIWEVSKAHDHLESGKAVGKITLTA